MDTYCGANCDSCPSRDGCRGCRATGGSPFGGRCVAAEYIKFGGLEAYRAFKEQLLAEINALLSAEGAPPAAGLHELVGAYVKLEYETPGGEKIRVLDDKYVYLGAQVELADSGLCCGVVADTTFILLCRYGEGGADPELVLFKKR